jgi:hypothetical protein
MGSSVKPSSKQSRRPVAPGRARSRRGVGVALTLALLTLTSCKVLVRPSDMEAWQLRSSQGTRIFRAEAERALSQRTISIRKLPGLMPSGGSSTRSMLPAELSRLDSLRDDLLRLNYREQAR